MGGMPGVRVSATARAADSAAMRRFALDAGSGRCRSPSCTFSMASRMTGMSICFWLRRTCGADWFRCAQLSRIAALQLSAFRNKTAQ